MSFSNKQLLECPEELERYLKKGLQVTKNLMVTAIDGKNLDTVKMLAKYSNDEVIKDRGLYFAIASDQLEIIKHLADNTHLEKYQLILYMAHAFEFGNLEALKYFHQKLGYLQIRESILEFSYKRNAELYKYLHQNGFDLSYSDNQLIKRVSNDNWLNLSKEDIEFIKFLLTLPEVVRDPKIFNEITTPLYYEIVRKKCILLNAFSNGRICNYLKMEIAEDPHFSPAQILGFIK